MPAFRADRRCEVVALAGSNLPRVRELARAANVPSACGDWRALLDDPAVQAVSIAVPPSLQSQIATDALALGKPVFAEKPIASTIEEAYAMLHKAQVSGLPAMIDFNFHQVASWQRAKTMLDEEMIGRRASCCRELACRNRSYSEAHFYLENLESWWWRGSRQLRQSLLPLSRMVLRSDRTIGCPVCRLTRS
jgi:predicted dehydrogenase